MLGPGWIERVRFDQGFEMVGPLPTLTVVVDGLLLEALDVVADPSQLVGRLQRGDLAAWSELHAIYLLRPARPRIEVETGPIVRVGSHRRVPDFRLRQGTDSPWTYVEVTQPDTSREERRLAALMADLTSILMRLEGRFALQVSLRRTPSPDEISAIVERCRSALERADAAVEELPAGLGLLSLNQSPPGQIVLGDDGEPPRPRIGRAQVIVVAGEPQRHVAVRLDYQDERAEIFLRREARQLPEDAPGLIMVDLARAPGGVTAWEPLLRRRFQPKIHTRISAICLFTAGFESSDGGEVWRSRGKLLLNPHAQRPIARSIATALGNMAADSDVPE